MSIYNSMIKLSVITLFGRLMNNNVELCSNWLFHSAANFSNSHSRKETQGKYIFQYFLNTDTNPSLHFTFPAQPGTFISMICHFRCCPHLILHNITITEMLLFNYAKVNTVFHSMTPLKSSSVQPAVDSALPSQ